ncbi:SH2 domain-containing protein 4A-like [Phlebotomus argentipes]|uniref:SH2 domain-containing protein 4A-like n=1 Tax=Phlebotomus argentipes TaxID=94469 RepID=UPI002892CE69|nr:SH2 domain-containing protein 4A-like [Phlebotomus argentipes]
MLQQILQDMRVEPELLEGLNETEKQTLFCIMREEQVRRWRAWDQEECRKSCSESARNSHKKTVTFLMGEDGDPWVWVMGEHPNDKTIDEILAEEAQLRARELAEQETQELRKSVEVKLSDIMELDQISHKLEDDEMPKIEDMEIYCSVDELRERINNSQNNPAPPAKPHKPSTANFNINSNAGDKKRDVLQEISLNSKATQKVAARVALWEQRLIGERTCEILRGMQQKQQDAEREAEEAARKEEELWKEQERKAKQAEIKRREIARKAREVHRMSLSCDQIEETEGQNSDDSTPDTKLNNLESRPANHEAVLKWYRDEEVPKGAGMDDHDRPLTWFHGFLSRSEAEHLLAPQPAGSFLVRVSEKVWGYAISYRDTDRCKHYLVDASNGRYQFLGANQLAHDSLNDLIRFHQMIPITVLGQERLRLPCPGDTHLEN